MPPEPHDKTLTPQKEPESTRTLIFGGLFARLFGSGDATRGSDAPETPRRSLEQLEAELKEMENRAEARLRESHHRRGKTSSLGADPGEPDNRQRLLEERRTARQALEEDIARLHEQLATGINKEQIERLRLLLLAHAADPEASAPSSIEERIERSVLLHLFRHAIQEAWHRFEGLIERSGLVWPVQEGLAEKVPPEELDRLRERHREEIHAAFLASSPRQISDVMQGNVKTWVYGYPNKHSYLWLQTALHGVAAALCGQFFAAAVELWMWRTMELERKLLAVVDEELKGPRLSLRQGIQSLAEAVAVASQVNRVCETVIPALVWSHVAPKLEWVRRGGVAPPISVLAAGVTQADPVCGMSLTAERVAARIESQERLLYFCSLPCLHRFEASPSQFVSRAPSASGLPFNDSTARSNDKATPS